MVALLTAFGLAATAHGAPVTVSAVNWDFFVNSQGFGNKLLEDCISTSRENQTWNEFSAKAPYRHTHGFEGIAKGSGTFDPAAGSGTIRGAGIALRFDQELAHSPAIRVGAFGLKVSRGHMTVTGRIARARTIFSRFGPPRALLRIKHVAYVEGPFQRKGKDLPNTFVMVLQGRAVVLPAFARALSRIRCRGSSLLRSRPIRAGAKFGVVRAQLRPDAAAGLGGRVEFGGDPLSTDNGPVTVTPTGAITASGSRWRVDLPAALRTPLTCVSGYECAPVAGAPIALGGGFVFSQGDRSAAVTDLALGVAPVNGVAQRVVTGTFNGATVTVDHGSNFAFDFADQLIAALGATDLTGSFGIVTTDFARTVAP